MRKLLLATLFFAILPACGMVDSQGLTWVRTIGADGGEVARDNVLLEVPEGAVMTDTVFTIEPATDVPEGNVGPAYMLAPDNVVFLTPLSIVFSLAREDLPDDVSYESLRIATVKGGVWKVLAASVPDEEAGTVTGEVTHFSIWGVFPIPPSLPEDLCEEVNCDDSDECTEDSCEEGECSHEVIPDCCIPEEEICDGKDNNCDGDVDEGCPDPCENVDCDDGDECTEDSCVEGTCFHELVPDCCIPEVEICDGKDNNCDGVADEGDVCVVEGCPVDPEVCDDGDPCTFDYCMEGTCIHEPDPGCCINQLEICDGLDNNCNDLVDEGFANIDGDPLADCIDDDDDGDGIIDTADNCITVMNGGQWDVDEDGAGDACDEDADDDGVANSDDCGPLDGLSFPGAEEQCDFMDNDCDGLVDEDFPDGCALDVDADGILGAMDNCPDNYNPSQVDLDGDGDGNECDPDDDDDGDPDVTDCEPADANSYAGAAEECDGIDNNCDGAVDEGYEDSDDNGEADCVQGQDDGDGVPDVDDNCPATFNPGQEDNDLDGLGDACDDDDDEDTILDDDDCDPMDPEVYPDAPELCDGKDNDCSDEIDDGDADADCDDQDPCTTDSCDPETGCVHAPIEGCE